MLRSNVLLQVSIRDVRPVPNVHQRLSDSTHAMSHVDKVALIGPASSLKCVCPPVTVPSASSATHALIHPVPGMSPNLYHEYVVAVLWHCLWD